MSLRCAVRIDKTATGFSAENLTIENTYNYLGDGTKSNESAGELLKRNLLIYGLGGIIVPFICIKIIDVILVGLGLV